MKEIFTSFNKIRIRTKKRIETLFYYEIIAELRLEVSEIER